MTKLHAARLSSLLLSLTLAAPAAAAEGPTLSPTFTPHPLETRVTLKNGDVSVTSRFPGCGTSFTTEAPAYTFTLTEPMADLRVWIDAPAVLVMPVEGSPYVCIKGGNAYYNDWPAGTYQVYLFSSSVGLGANIRIEMPERARAEAGALVAAATALDLDADGPANPRWLTLKGGAGVRPELAGVACGRPGMAPLARVTVKQDGPWTFTPERGRSLYVVNAKGGCLERSGHLGEYALKAGQGYVLWGWVEGGAAGLDFELAVAAGDRPERFPRSDAPVYELGALTSPMALPSQLLPVTWGISRMGACRGLPRTPSFFVHTTEAVGQIALEPLRHAGKAPRMVAYGPLEDVLPRRDWRCDETTKVVLGGAAGKTWAVFLTQQDGEVGAPIVTVARRLAAKPDPMSAPVAVPAELALTERRLGFHYPFYGKTSVERFFLEAPEQLFVWLPEAVGDAPAGEPLALRSAREGVARVTRFDGSDHEVPVSALTTERPAKVALPKQHPPVKQAKDLDEALSLAGPADKPLVEKYQEAEDAYRGCVGEYMRKHDPSWGKSYELIYVNSGRNVSDVWFRRADRACNYAGLEAQGKRLTRAINKARKKGAADYLKALKARFTP